jgi:nickel/cobalt transporter (NiCoT) family protein
MSKLNESDRGGNAAFGLAGLLRVFDDSQSDARAKIVAIYAVLIALNAIAWIVAVIAFAGGHSLLLGTALLAYTFGLRHAVDADHISAIDNVTRKLMQENKRPVSVGFFFSLGHSTIVVILTLLIAVAAAALKRSLPELQYIGGFLGTSISAIFLFAIAAINIVVLIEIAQAFTQVRAGKPYCDRTLYESLDQRGLMSRFCGPLLKCVAKSWHMYPIGLLFGLGFDTATEVGLLGIAAVETGNGLSIWSILIFPALFTVGMSLVDTTDGILMLGAYGWAFAKPVRKLFYNMTITATSVLVALLVGGIEVFSIIGSRLGLHGTFWNGISGASNNFGELGFIIIGVFVVSWLASIAVYRLRRFDDIDVGAA